MIDKDIEIEIEIYTEYFWGDEISKGNKKGRKEQYQETGVREVKINTRKKMFTLDLSTQRSAIIIEIEAFLKCGFENQDKIKECIQGKDM